MKQRTDRPAQIDSGGSCVFLDHTAAWSGGEIALARLVEPLGRTVARVVVAEDGPLTRRLQEHGLTVEVLELPSRTRTRSRAQSATGLRSVVPVIDVLRYSWQLSVYLRQAGSAVVHTNSLKSGIYGCLAARLARVPVMWHVRDRIADDYLPKRLRQLVQLLLVVLPDAVLVNSETTASTLGPTRRVVPVKVLDDPYRPEGSPTPRNAPLDPPVVALVGRLSPWKGQHVFLDALELLAQRKPVKGLLLGKALFGEEEYAREIEQRVSANATAGSATSEVELSSFSGEVADALRDVDVVVNASVIPEPFGQVVVEAIANGVPVVVPDVGGPAEIVQHGVNGLHFRSGDAASLADRLDQLLGDPDLYERLSVNGLERAKHYEPERIAAEFLDFAQSVRRIPMRTRLWRLIRARSRTRP